MDKIKFKNILRILLIITVFSACIFIMISGIKSFNEWNRSYDSYKPEIITKFKDNKYTFIDIVSFIQGVADEIDITRGKGTNYEYFKYNDKNQSYSTIGDEIVDKKIQLVFKDNFVNISKDRGAIYFIYRNDWGGAQGVVYTDDPKKLVRYSYIETEEIENDWYYFIGQ